jgi:uncharacterized short protein YbdD (DUF466 family)
LKTLRTIVNYIRQVMGDDAYARYCRHLDATGRAAEAPTAKQFYLESLERKYKGVSRCC